MKHTRHNDPFDYDQYQDESFWDFSWENDWPTVVAVGGMIAVAGTIYLIASV